MHSIRLTLCLAGLLCVAAGCSNESAPESEMAMNTYTPKIITPEERRIIPYVGHDVGVLASIEDAEAGIAVHEEILRPKTMGAPPHIHEDEDEYFIVLEGRVTFLNGEDTVDAGPGTVAILPRGHWHGFWNATNEPVRMILVIAPGHFGSFFDEVVMTIREENADTPESIGGIIARVAASRNVTVDMSRLPAEAAALLAPSQ